jgi:hypothetical protein
MNTSIIRNAIASRNIIEFTYKGYPRIAEPHIYGMKNGKRQLLVYQIGGATSSGGGSIPSWRRMDINEISGLKVTDRKFAGPRDNPSMEHSNWDTIIAKVER